MVNLGYAFMGYRELDFGTAFIASFDIKSGDQKYLKTVTTENKDKIRAVDLNNGELLLLFKDHVSRFTVEDGQLLQDQKFHTEVFGELKYFVGEQVFVQKDNLFHSLQNSDAAKHYLYTGTGKILILNSNLELVETMDTEAKAIYINYFNRNGKRFLAKENRTFVIDPEGKKLAEFSASRNAVFLNGKFYDAQENSFLEIELENLFNKSLQ